MNKMQLIAVKETLSSCVKGVRCMLIVTAQFRFIRKEVKAGLG